MVFRRGRSKKGLVIDSQKHEIRTLNLLETGATFRNVVIALAKNTEDISADNHVKTGSQIKAIFFELNFNVEGNITTVIDWALVKANAGLGVTSANFNPATPNLITRSSKFLWGMEMPAGINNSGAVKRVGTLLIPKGKQTMREGESWQFVYFTAAAGDISDVCGHFIYKEYR